MNYHRLYNIHSSNKIVVRNNTYLFHLYRVFTAIFFWQKIFFSSLNFFLLKSLKINIYEYPKKKL